LIYQWGFSPCKELLRPDIGALLALAHAGIDAPRYALSRSVRKEQ